MEDEFDHYDNWQDTLEFMNLWRVPAMPMYLANGQLSGTKPGGHVLIETRFGPKRRAHADQGRHPVVHAGMPRLRGGAEEVWVSTTPVTYGKQDHVRYAHNGELLFAHSSCPLPESGQALEAAIGGQYKAILQIIANSGYPHLIRIWNYLPWINRHIDGLECYQRFCRARHHAFAEYFKELIANLPATSVVGTSDDDFHLIFVTSRHQPRHYENPRQISAYDYPPQYGPKSPLFARATLATWGEQRALFVSGTASIVGHESRHPGDVNTQLAEVERNMQALIARVESDGWAENHAAGGTGHARVYLRHAGDLAAVEPRIGALFGGRRSVLCLNADICRPDLLVEMEGVLVGRNPRQVAPKP